MTNDKRRKGEEKQTERIEVRLGVTLRDQFLDACKRVGDTPSDVLRAAMSGYVAEVRLAERKTLRQELTMKLIHNPLKTAGMALTSLAAFALIAAPSSADERLFKALDSNGDGVLTETDSAPLEQVIRILDEDGSRSITLDEFRTMVRYGLFSLPKTAEGMPRLDIDIAHLENDPNEADASGDLGITWTPADEHGNEGLIKENVPITQISLVTMDLTSLGEVRFKSESATLDELAEINEPGFTILFEGRLIDSDMSEAAETETP